MRARDETLRTGRLLLAGSERAGAPCGGMLFLIRGYSDVEALACIERAAGAVMEDLDPKCFRWLDVADRDKLAELDAAVDPSRVLAIEAAEFAEVSAEEAIAVLEIALRRALTGVAALLPVAGAAVGAAAEDVQFLGREPEIEQLLVALREHAAVLFSGPRRTGKTSLLRELVRRGGEGFRFAYVDVEGAFTLEEAAALIVAGVSDRSVPAAAERARCLGEAGALGEALATFGAAPGTRAVLFLDELVYFLRTVTAEQEPAERPDVVRSVLRTLADAAAECKVGLLVAGSIDLAEYLSAELALEGEEIPDFVRNSYRFVLPPLDAAPGCLHALLMGAGVVPEAGDAAWLREHLDLAMPRPALAFLDELASRIRSRGPLATGELEPLLDRFVDRSADFRELLDRMQGRFGECPGFREALVGFMGRLVLAGDTGLEEDSARYDFGSLLDAEPESSIRWVVENLPVRRRDGRLVLASRIFGRWWRRRHGS